MATQNDLITCQFAREGGNDPESGCMGQFKRPPRIQGERATWCPNCRSRIGRWEPILAKDPDRARLYRKRLYLRSASMDEVLTHVKGNIVPLRRRKHG